MNIKVAGLIIVFALLYSVYGLTAQEEVKPEMQEGASALDSLSPAELPDSLQYAPKLGSEYARYEGIWRGQWEGTLDAYLVITQISNEKVKAYYAWGTNLIVRNRGGKEVAGVIQNGTLIFPMQNGYSLVFSSEDGIHLSGISYSPRTIKPSRILMSRVSHPSGGGDARLP